MSEERQNTISSPMDKETEHNDEIANTSNNLIPQVIEQTAANLDELKQSIDRWDAEERAMSEEDQHESSIGGLTQQKVEQHLKHFFAMRRVFAEHGGDVLEDQEVNRPCTSPTQSEDSRMTYSPSWCSNPDSDISEIITFDAQNVDEEIKKVCQSFLDPENLEEEAEHFGDRGEVWTAETASLLSIRSEEFEIPASTASSPSTTTPITAAATGLVSQVIEEAVRTMQTIEAVTKMHTNDSDRKAEKPAGKSFFKKLTSECKKQSKKVKKVSERDVDKAIEDRGASSKFDISSTLLELIEEKEDTTEHETFVPSPASTSLFSPEGQPLAQTAIDFQEELRSWKSRDDSCDGALMAAADTDGEMVDKLAIEGQEEYENNEVGGQTTKSPLDLDISEKGAEDLKERDKVCISETGSTSRLSATLEERERATSSASSTSSAIFEVANMIVAQAAQQDVRTLEPIDSERPASRPVVKRIKVMSKNPFGKTQSKKVETVSECHVDEASPKPDLISIPLKKEQDETPAEHQRSFSLQQQFAEPLEEDQGMETNLPPGPSEKDGHTAADRQWREVTKGFYSQDVKEQPIDMYMDLKRFISESVTKNVLQGIHQSSTTSGTFTQRSSLLQNIHTSFESSFTQAVCDVVGVDTPVRVSPKFTEAMAGEVIEEVNSVLSVAISSSVRAAASCRESKDKAAKKTLAGAIAPMKSFLTGRGTEVKRRIQTQRGLDDSKDKRPARRCKTKKRNSLWRMCVMRNIKVHPTPVEDLNEAVEPRSTQDRKQSSHSLQEKSPSTAHLRSTPLVLVDIENEDMTDEDTRDVVSSPQEKSPTTSSSDALKANLRSTPLVSADKEDEDMTGEVSSLSSTRSSLPGHQVFEGLDDPPLAEATTDEDQEGMSYQSNESGDEDEEETSSQISASQDEQTRAKKRNSFCSFFRSIFSKNDNKKKEKKTARDKRPPLWSQLFSCSACCCLDN